MIVDKEGEAMNNEKGASTLLIILLIALAIAFAIYWSKYFSRPMADVMMQGADQAQPAIEKAEQSKETMDRLTRSAEDVAKKASQGTE